MRRLWLIIYNLYGHPLRQIPGPKLYAVSHIPKMWRGSVVGKHWSDLVSLHEKYGDVVRIGPDEVSCVSLQSWKTIHGAGMNHFQRDPDFTNIFPGGAETLGASDNQQHRAFRTLITPVFSEKTLAAQEPQLVRWADVMINALKERSDQPIDIALAFEWAAIDVMGELMLGKSFDCLENFETPRWTSLLHTGQESLAILQIMLRFKVLTFFYNAILRLPILERWIESLSLTKAQTKTRLDLGAREKRDAMTLLWDEARSSKVPISRGQIEGVSALLFIAGSETTAAALSGIIWLLLSTPQAYERLAREIRSLREEDLTPKTLSSLTYLNCTIQEGLRLHSPAAIAINRIVPEGGTTIDGHYLPEGVSSPRNTHALVARSSNTSCR